jgi:putative membrane-bound dehydrogenase-like protein
MSPRRLARSLAIALPLLTPGLARADGYPPEEARARMVVPEGFHVEVVASEPIIRQPVTASFDERGRLWVIEYLQYPNPAGLKPVTVDQYLRTEYDRVPEPPPKGPRGADRIKILEDTDGDGRMDKATIFVEGLNLASGLAVGHGGVFVGQAPYLLFYPDKDKDDKPDGDPEVLLSGFGLQDAHATVNSMAFGPDGWLYGAQGSTVTAKIRGVEFQQGIWRYHPKSKRFELFAEGGGNTWGLDWDAAGNAFGSSNGAFIAFHMVQGGFYWKGFAKHGPLHNPHTYGYFDSIAYDAPKQGGHVTPGGIIYKGDAYPPSFRGKFIGGNLLSNTVYWHDLRPEGSTFRGKHGGRLIDARDTWFRPIDLTLGPDGCVYVVDWYDRRASHLDPRDNWDKTNGRIYRVVYGQRKKVPPFDLSKLSTDALIDLRTSPNDWQAETARRILAERRDTAAIPRLKALLAEDRDEAIALRDLWALNLCGGLDDSTALGLMSHPVAAVRRWTVRLLGDDRRMTPSLAASLRHLAESDPDPLVRSQLASSCQRWASADAFPILDALLTRSEDANDRQIPLLLWWACERHLANDHRASVGHMVRFDFLGRPLARAAIVERLARLLISSGDPNDDRACAAILGLASAGPDLDRVVGGMLKGLEGRKVVEIAPALNREVSRIQAGPDTKLDRRLLALRLGSPSALGFALEAVADPKAPEAARVAQIEILGQLGRDEALPVLLGLVARDDKPKVRLAALAAVASEDRPEVASALLDGYATFPKALQARAIDLLASRRLWAGWLVDAIAAGKIPAKDVTNAQAQAIARHGDDALKSRLESAWGRLPGPGSAEKVKRIAEVRGMLVEGDKGSAARGRVVFKDVCATCHRLFDEGEKIGPELTQSERGNLDFLLTSVVDPSALIRKEYQARTVATTDGRVLNGLVLDENDRTITLADSKGQKSVIPVSEVEASRPSDVSLMPEGLLDPLKEEQVRDLFKYLQSSGAPAR